MTPVPCVDLLHTCQRPSLRARFRRYARTLCQLDPATGPWRRLRWCTGHVDSVLRQGGRTGGAVHLHNLYLFDVNA